MNIKIIINQVVGRISSILNNLKSSRCSDVPRSPRITLPSTNPDWHTDYDAKTEMSNPAHFIVALKPMGGDGGQRGWLDEVLEALDGVCQSILDGDDIPMTLNDSKSGEVIGEIIILDRAAGDWDGAIKMMKAKLDESESG